jgi:hypothetical protein
MPKELVVGTEVFEFPEQGENAGWGEQVTDWAIAVTDALETVQAPGDILVTTAVISNNISSAASIVGFSFNSTEVASFTAEYYIERNTNVPAVFLTQRGTLTGLYNGSSWDFTNQFFGSSGVTFSITSGGQVQYISTNMTGSNYAGTVTFSAKAITQPA